MWSSQVLPQQCCIFNYPQTQWVDRIHTYFLAPLSAGSLQFVEQGSQLLGSGSRLHHAHVFILGYKLKIIVYLGHFSLRSGSLESRRVCCAMKQHFKARLDSCTLTSPWPKTAWGQSQAKRRRNAIHPIPGHGKWVKVKYSNRALKIGNFAALLICLYVTGQFLVYFLVLFGL